MIEDFRARYPSKSRFEYLYPSIVSLPLANHADKCRNHFALGSWQTLPLPKGWTLSWRHFECCDKRDVTYTSVWPVRAAR